MELNFKKYDHIEFHENKKVSDRIKAYMIIFDYQASINRLTDVKRVALWDNWEKVFLNKEFYEIIPAIEQRRGKLKEQIKYDKLSAIYKVAHKLSCLVEMINNRKR